MLNAGVRLGAFAVALKAFDNVIRLKPDHAFAHYFAAQCHKGMDDMEAYEEDVAACYVHAATPFWQKYVEYFKLPTKPGEAPGVWDRDAIPGNEDTDTHRGYAPRHLAVASGSYLIDTRPPRVLSRFRRHSVGDIGVSSLTVAELAYGVAKSGSERNRAALEGLLCHWKSPTSMKRPPGSSGTSGARSNAPASPSGRTTCRSPRMHWLSDALS